MTVPSPQAMPKGRPLVLVVDDEPSVIFLVRELLDRERVNGAGDADAMVASMKSERPDLILLDVGLPDVDGFELASRLRGQPDSPPFIFLSARDSGEDAAWGISLGALDYVRKPFAATELVARVRSALVRVGTRQDAGGKTQSGAGTGEAVAAADRVAPDRRATVYGSIVGKSAVMEELIALLDRAASIDATVLLLGESGSGKELFARAFHEATGRGMKPFVAVNCAAVPRELAEGLFFGHAKGSFTGAQSDKPGWFEEARGGTLFLDEVGDLPMELQGVLLRAVESRRIRRLGESGERGLDIRLVAATNRDLQSAVRQGNFRADLYYRLEEIPITIPPLDQRREDIPLLIDAFLDEFARLSPFGRIELGPRAMAGLQMRSWPGNVRELRNSIRRTVVSARSSRVEELQEGSAKPGEPTKAPPVQLPAGGSESLAGLEHTAVESALAKTHGEVAEAAAILGISRATLYRRLRKYHIEPQRFSRK